MDVVERARRVRAFGRVEESLDMRVARAVRTAARDAVSRLRTVGRCNGKGRVGVGGGRGRSGGGGGRWEGEAGRGWWEVRRGRWAWEVGGGGAWEVGGRGDGGRLTIGPSYGAFLASAASASACEYLCK